MSIVLVMAYDSMLVLESQIYKQEFGWVGRTKMEVVVLSIAELHSQDISKYFNAVPEFNIPRQEHQ